MFIDVKTELPKAVAVHEIVKVERTNHASGAGRGALIGGGATFATFAVRAATKRKNWEEESGSSGLIDVLELGGFTIVGTVLGTLIGADIGIHDSYVFNNRQSEEPPSVQEDRPIELADDSQDIKRVIKCGIDIGDVFLQNNGSFNLTPGFAFSYLTGKKRFQRGRDYFALGFELGYTQINDYYPNVVHEYVYAPAYNSRYVFDIRERLSYADIGVLMEYFCPVSNDVLLAAYFGGALGVGVENTTVNQLSHELVASTNHQGLDYYYGRPAGYQDHLSRAVTCGTIGASIYYNKIMVDLRYKSADMSQGGNFNNFFLQIGYVL